MPKTQGEKYSEIIISHPGTDFDSLASMWAAHLLAPNRPVVMIAAVDSNVREFLALYDQEFPRKKLKQIDIGSVRHLTVVDCSSRSQLSRIEGLLDRKDVFIEVWDHHRESGHEFRVDKKNFAEVGANTTMLVQELKRSGIIPSPAEATLLLLGIYEDTGSLRFPTTRPDDLDASSWLLRSGASLDMVDKFIGIRLSPAQKELLTTLCLNVRVMEVRGVPIHITQANALEFVDEIAFLARKVQETESADVLFALVQLNDRVFIVGRSRLPAVNVGQILSTFGGGGHSQAASCLLTGATHPVALQRLLDAVREQVMPSILALDIMTTPVRTIHPDALIEEAHSIIAHTGYSGLVVADDDNPLVGVITRSDVDKALQHDLGHAPVKGYMVRDPVVISENATLGEIQNKIIEMRVGFLPVIFGGKVTGVVTRTDVLRAHHRASVRSVTMTDLMDEGENGEFGLELLARLPASHLDLLALAGEVADANGVTCYLVGGIIRDLVLDHSNVDIDLLIEGDGIEFAHLFAMSLGARVIENTRFRTAKVITDIGLTVDVATARDEFYIRPGALPNIEAAGIRDDLVRRDFTINTLAIQLNTRKWGRHVDHFNGVADIRNGLIRVLHTFSFVDDPTRILRALRFSERYGFSLENQTETLLKRAIQEGRLDDVSPERLRDEFLLCLGEVDPWRVLVRICEEGIFGILEQSLQPPAFLRERVDLVKPALDWIAEYLPPEEIPSREHVYLAYLLSESDPADVMAFVKKYRFDRSIIRLAAAFTDFADTYRKLELPDIRSSELVIALEKLPQLLWVVLAVSRDDECPRRANLKRYFTELRKISSLIDGNDFIQAGFEPCPAFGKALAAIRRAKIDGEISSRDEEMALAIEILTGEE